MNKIKMTSKSQRSENNNNNKKIITIIQLNYFTLTFFCFQSKNRLYPSITSPPISNHDGSQAVYQTELNPPVYSTEEYINSHGQSSTKMMEHLYSTSTVRIYY